MFDYDVVLLDIEGTTTPISFVKDILFPYVRDNVRDFLEKYWGTDQCRVDVEALRNQAKEDKDMEDVVLIPDEEENLSQDNSGASKETIVDAVVANVIWQMNSDRKTTALKQLQGHIWRKAFDDGVIKGDVPSCFTTECLMMLLQLSRDGLQTKSKFIFTHLEAQTLKSFCLVIPSVGTFYSI